MERLRINYPAHRPTPAEWKEWLGQAWISLERHSIDNIRHGVRAHCERSQYWPTVAELLKAVRSANTGPKPAHTSQKFGGGCTCAQCGDKIPTPGFYRAPRDEQAESAALDLACRYRAEMDTPSSKLDGAEIDRRCKMIGALLMEGETHEKARKRVMLERTRALYPDNAWAKLARLDSNGAVVIP